MSTEVALRSSEVPAAFSEQMHMAAALAESDLLPSHLRRKPANVLVIIQGARALDVSAFWALQSMHVIEGKLSMAAELMRALVIRAGHKVNIVERSDERATVEIQRKDKDKPYRASFTWAEAVAAELDTKTNWRRYRKAMLVARATSIAVRDECPDVMFGVVYTPDELGAVTDEEGVPVIDGTTVEPPTEEDVARWCEALGHGELVDVIVAWSEITDKGATKLVLPEAAETGETLLDYAMYRLGLEASTARSKVEVREIWQAAKTMRIDLTATITSGGEKISLRDYFVSAAEGLPEEVPADETEPMVLVDTEHAEQLREAAAASWEEGKDEQPAG